MLGLVTSEFLYRKHPNEHEGQLTKTKSLLVSKAILSRRALAMGLGKYVLMSQSESESGGRQRLSILADAFESVIGAIYLDQGFEAARAFITEWLLSDTQEIVADKRHTNYKSHLQEYVQSTFRTHPVYRIRSEMGPDHSKQFNVEVLVGRRLLGSGRGRNKKEAEQAAARNALEAVETGPRSEPSAPRPAPARSAARTQPAAPASPAVARPARDDDDDDDGDDDGPRRRRGRRGGRGRRREEGAVAGAPHPAPAPERPAERAHPRPETQAAPAAGVPVVGKRFEDDADDEGHPEGRLEERRVDPYGWGRDADEPGRAEAPSESMSRGIGGRTVERLTSFAPEPERPAPVREMPVAHEAREGITRAEESAPPRRDEPRPRRDEAREARRDEPRPRRDEEREARRDEPHARRDETRDTRREEPRNDEPGETAGDEALPEAGRDTPGGEAGESGAPGTGRSFGRRPGRRR